MKEFLVTNVTTGDEEFYEASYFILKDGVYLIIRRDKDDPNMCYTILGVPANSYAIKLIEQI